MSQEVWVFIVGFFFFSPELSKFRYNEEKAWKGSEKFCFFQIEMRKDYDLKEMGRKKPE